MVLPETGFDKNLPTVFVIHGYVAGYEYLEIFEREWRHLAGKINLIGIDWSKGANTWNYIAAVARTATVGSAVGQFILEAIRNRLIADPDSIHVIGHSLGAHAAGFVGKHMAGDRTYPIKLRHITALDAAGPLVGIYPCSYRLCNTDATFVEALHTNGGVLGMYRPIESLDLYLNGGKKQPGCQYPSCSHAYSHEFYRSVLDQYRLDGWLCNDLNQMESEKLCRLVDNPRRYSFDIIQKGTVNTGIVYAPTVTFIDTGNDGSSTRKRIPTDQLGDYTTVVFGANVNNAVVLISLLSDDGHLIIEKRNDEVVVVNPANAAWTPDPKYHLVDETEPRRIAKRLGELARPFRFVVAFDATDMFTDPFWEMIYYLSDYQKSYAFIDEIQMVAMGIPHDGIPLQRHVDELKSAVKNGLEHHYAVDFQMAGMHMITKSGVVREISELQQELIDIKSIVGKYLNRNPTGTLNTIVKEN
ncbi:hypothetical protein HA402_005751 [Bradysia odoriphaga]|nr:hypothetical protein HA402_005751 [Bradysia odoriphaga]